MRDRVETENLQIQYGPQSIPATPEARKENNSRGSGKLGFAKWDLDPSKKIEKKI